MLGELGDEFDDRGSGDVEVVTGGSDPGHIDGTSSPDVRKNKTGEAKVSNVVAGLANSLTFRA